METKTKRVFIAGDGAPPPALTGRASQQAVLHRCLAGLGDGAAPPHNVVLVGPRGSGKTVLLRWFENACLRHQPAVDVISLAPSRVADHAALFHALAPRPLLAKLLPRKLGIASAGSAEWTSSNGSSDLTAALIRRCRRRPLAVLFDEAHTLKPDVGIALLNASQEIRGAQTPFLLVLAGTPGLPAHLDNMNASFWSCLGEGELGIGRLSDSAAREALTEPLREHDVEISTDALDAVVAHTQGYPYFVQLWGDALWQRHLAIGAPTVSVDFVAAVRPTVDSQMANYYRRRFAELESENLVPAAVALARLFECGSSADASDQEVDAALAAAGIDDPAVRFTTRETLHRLGYIWQPPDQHAPFRWHAGIPSLMAHVLKQAGS